jgi:hypothetical protein
MFASIKRYAMRDIKFKDMAQQTAVEWLVEQLNKNENIRWRGAPVSELTEQAKSMEKEQIMQSHIDGFDHIVAEFKKKEYAEKYYNETYKKQ